MNIEISNFNHPVLSTFVFFKIGDDDQLILYMEEIDNIKKEYNLIIKKEDLENFFKLYINKRFKNDDSSLDEFIDLHAKKEKYMDSDLKKYLDSKENGDEIKNLLRDRSGGTLILNEISIEKQKFFNKKVKSYGVKLHNHHDKNFPSEKQNVYKCVVGVHSYPKDVTFDDEESEFRCLSCGNKILTNASFVSSKIGKPNMIKITFGDLHIRY